MKKAQILLIAFEFELDQLFDGVSETCSFTRVEADLEELLEPFKPTPDVILCGPMPEGVSLIEVAQALRMHNPEAPIFYATSARAGYDRKTFVKNGFSEAFLLPLDISVLKTQLKDAISKISGNGQQIYRPVKLIDIEAGTSLDFDTTLYLPANNKYIPYSSAGETIDADRLKKLEAHKMSSIYVSAEQMPKFYDYTAKQLQKLGASGQISATEKKEKLESSIRELMSGIFNDSAKDASFEQGQSLVKDCQEIVKSYVIGSSGGDWYKKLLNAMGDLSSGYSHPVNVSTYASLFAIGLQIGNPNDLATAGLLHDIGLADVPQDIVLKPEEQRTPEEQNQYQRHCEHSINIIKARRIVIPESVHKAILQHHECFNGTGYPNNLIGSRLSAEAQILAFADRFDEMTSAAEGKPLKSPTEAVLYFKNMMINDPAKMIFDPDLLKKILKLFP